jgi:hypothetical protein
VNWSNIFELEKKNLKSTWQFSQANNIQSSMHGPFLKELKMGLVSLSSPF